MPCSPGRRRPRAQCPLGPLGVHCHAYGNEGACGLCGIIDFGHPVTAVTLGLALPPDTYELAEREVVAHLDRCMRTGWTPKHGTQLDKLAREHDLYGQRSARVVAAARARAADDPAPF